MDNFEEILKQYEPMIKSILRKTNIYKNHDHFYQVACIALWQAWRNFDSTKGHFPSYAYRVVQTSIYREMHKDNQYMKRHIPVEKDELSIVGQSNDLKNMPYGHVTTLETLAAYLTEEEFELLKDLYYHQYKYEELTHKYNASVAALKKRRDRIIKKLRIELKGTAD